jgi:CrcB protein
MPLWIAVALGGAVGSVLRFWLSQLVQNSFSQRTSMGSPWFEFPWGTLLVNASGSLLIGLLLPLVQKNSLGEAFLLIGVCGGYTTFSAFSLQSLQLCEKGHLFPAAAYVAASIVSCLLATGAGIFLARFALAK